METLAVGAFTLSATALLGSPGPGIAALVSIGRSQGLSRGLRFFAGLQVGLAAAATISAAGLLSILQAFPAALQAMTWIATAYLIYLAYRIATAPLKAPAGAAPASSSALAGLLLGITNPKAFVAFATLFASRSLVPANPGADLVLKLALIVSVILVVDLAWLFVGVALNQARLRPATDRALNIALAAMVLAAAVLGLL